jgi:hypothetical protein
MRTLPVCLASLALLVVGILAGCSQTPPKSPDVSDAIRKSLDQAGFKDVSVAQDREKTTGSFRQGQNGKKAKATPWWLADF